MGNLFSFFKKSKGTKEQLEDIQNEIDQIEEYKISVFVKEKNYIAFLIIGSVLAYIIGAIYFYINHSKDNSVRYNVFWALFFILSTCVIYFAKKFIRFYFKWVNDANNIKLVALIKLKKRIISKVQETETFNDAKSILERYDPSALRNLSLSLSNLSSIDNDSPLRRPRQQQSNQPVTSPRTFTQPRPALHNQPSRPSYSVNSIAPFPAQNFSNFQPRAPISRTVKPILPQHRSVVEKMVDYVFSDGPTNRYGLICAQCHSHNGMALPQEFEYTSYICAYCSYFNPSRKTKPPAPIMDLSRAIEGPKVEEVDDKEDQNTKTDLNITEISTELNKTVVSVAEESKEDRTIVEETIENSGQNKDEN